MGVAVDNEPGSTTEGTLPMLPQTTVGLVSSRAFRRGLDYLQWTHEVRSEGRFIPPCRANRNRDNGETVGIADSQ
jgi:hypothetical protein